MAQFVDQFFHWVNNTYLFGLTIDHFFHIGICFTLFLVFRLVFKLKTQWCLLLILLIGSAKVWYSWGAMLSNGRYENPVQKMFDNFLGAGIAYLLVRTFKKKPERR
ncbi:MAG: hypothetical protein ACXWQO_06010 [Bdellovibrionota bacterium]